MRPRWIPTNSGGSRREYELEDKGLDLVRLAKEEEIVPNEWYYIKDPLRGNVFLKQQFAPEVEWQTILDFLSLNKIYVKKETIEPISESESQLKLL